jgi:hypothetical protein
MRSLKVGHGITQTFAEATIPVRMVVFLAQNFPDVLAHAPNYLLLLRIDRLSLLQFSV